MITTTDFIKLPYTTDLSEGGTTFAKRSLAQRYDRLGASVYSRLRSVAGNTAVELAFRRQLTEKGVPFEVQSAQPFSDPERYDVMLGKRRCILNTFVSSKRSQITAMRRDPMLVLQTPAMIPEDQLSIANLREHDLYLFAFLFGLTTNTMDEIRKAVDAAQPIHLVHAMKVEWSHPENWVPLGRISVKSECNTPVVVEVGGQDSERNFVTERLTLDPLTRVSLKENYYSLAYMHIDRLPSARVGIHSATLGDTYLIQPHEWSNIWIYGLEIWLAGYMAQDEFRRKASTVFTGSRVFQYSRTQAKNLSVPVEELRSLPDLYEQVKNWEAIKKTW